MKIEELDKLIDSVYQSVGIQYAEDFRNILGGCHCYPPTEWYGDIYLAFKKILNDNAIEDKCIKAQLIEVIEQLSNGFQNKH
jgi:hypothetical protein